MSLGQLAKVRVCARACAPAVRACTRMPKTSTLMKAVEKSYRAAEKTATKQLAWAYLPCADFRKKYVGRIVACFKNVIGSSRAICDQNPYN